MYAVYPVYYKQRLIGWLRLPFYMEIYQDEAFKLYSSPKFVLNPFDATDISELAPYVVHIHTFVPRRNAHFEIDCVKWLENLDDFMFRENPSRSFSWELPVIYDETENAARYIYA